FLGGTSADVGTGIAVDTAGNAYVTGFTESAAFPTAAPFQPALHGPRDAFVAKLNAGATALLYSTYLGGAGSDAGLGIAVDKFGDTYVTGSTQSGDFPTTPDTRQPAFGGGTDAFVARLGATGREVYGTYLGGSGTESGNAIAVTPAGVAFVAGSTTSNPGFPTANPEQPGYGGGPHHALPAPLVG